MSSFNKVILMGNITRDIEVRTISSGTKYVNIGLAINRTFTQEGQKKEDVTFVDVTFWGRQAEVLAQYLKKGAPLMIEGRLKMDSWKDDQGQQRTKLKVQGESFQFLGGTSAPDENVGNSDQQSIPAKKSYTPNKAQKEENYPPKKSNIVHSNSQYGQNDFDSYSSDDIPF